MNLKQLVTSTVGAGACTPTAQFSLPKPRVGPPFVGCVLASFLLL